MYVAPTRQRELQIIQIRSLSAVNDLYDMYMIYPRHETSLYISPFGTSEPKIDDKNDEYITTGDHSK